MTLLPCPLCYSESSFHWNDDDPYCSVLSVICSGCDLTLPAGEMDDYDDTVEKTNALKAAATARWNTRPETA
jgi:hypothetical protein